MHSHAAVAVESHFLYLAVSCSNAADEHVHTTVYMYGGSFHLMHQLLATGPHAI